jgi:coenzyme PQQ synthesis protein D (PqqD)
MARFARSPQAVVRPLKEGEGAVALNLTSGQYHGLNETGRIVWDQLESPMSEAELVAAVRERLPDAPPQVGADVAAFLAAMQSRALVVQID